MLPRRFLHVIIKQIRQTQTEDRAKNRIKKASDGVESQCKDRNGDRCDEMFDESAMIRESHVFLTIENVIDTLDIFLRGTP